LPKEEIFTNKLKISNLQTNKSKAKTTDIKKNKYVYKFTHVNNENKQSKILNVFRYNRKISY